MRLIAYDWLDTTPRLLAAGVLATAACVPVAIHVPGPPLTVASALALSSLLLIVPVLFVMKSG